MGRFPTLSVCMRVVSFLGICVTSIVLVDQELNTEDIFSGSQSELHNPGYKVLAVTPDESLLWERRPEDEQLNALKRSITDHYIERGYEPSSVQSSAQLSSSGALVIIVVERKGGAAVDSQGVPLWRRSSSVSSTRGEVFKL